MDNGNIIAPTDYQRLEKAISVLQTDKENREKEDVEMLAKLLEERPFFKDPK